jgi:hypothetical protein
MATVMWVDAGDDDDVEAAAEAEAVVVAAGAELAGAELAGAELLELLLVTEQPASASAATAASGRMRRGPRPADVIFLDISSSLGRD